MATSVRRHPLLAFYLLTFAISWGGFLLVARGALVTSNWQASGVFAYAVIVMLAGPATASLLLTGFLDGRSGYRDLWARLIAWRAGLGWYAVAILPAPAVCAGVLLALSIPLPLFAGGSRWALFLSGAFAGLTTVLEEVGWTGFVTPRLRRRHSVLITGLIIGVPWGLWHLLQQIFIAGTYAGGIALPAFVTLSVLAAVASLTAYRILLVWLYDRTGSLFMTTVMHAMLTASSVFWFSPPVVGRLFLANVYLVAAALWVLVFVVAAADGWIRIGRTKPFRAPDGTVLWNSIAEARYLRLGGVDQWVLIRSENAANPPLIVLHGGPGMSEMGFFRCFNAPLERHFTVVHWDQRGTNKSFDRSIPKESMTVAQFVADLDELVEFVRRYFGKRKVAILGHSWGSTLGAIYAARFPEKVSVYVGAAQIGSGADAEQLSYAYGVAEAERQGDARALRQLLAIGPPPYPARSVFVERSIINRLDGMMRPGILWHTARMLFGPPEASFFDLPNFLRGFVWTMDAMWPEVSALNLLKEVPVLKVPVFIFVGARDHWVPPDTSVAFFDALTAPSKKLVRFEHSGHEAFMDEPDKFNAAMVEMVLPLASAPASGMPVPLPVSA